MGTALPEIPSNITSLGFSIRSEGLIFSQIFLKKQGGGGQGQMKIKGTQKKLDLRNGVKKMRLKRGK